jgi:hypothetical protein
MDSSWLDVATGIVLIVLGAAAGAFPRLFGAYLDATAGRTAKDDADRGLRWGWEVYPVQRRILLWVVPPGLVGLGVVFLVAGLSA